jgi:drug/metabolite transporter (DMT)-like permease
VGAVAVTGIQGARTSTGLTVWGPLLALWLVWGSTYFGIAVMGTSMPPMVANGLRFLIAAAILALTLLIARGPRVLAVTLPQLRSMAIMGVGLLGVAIGTVSMAERFVPSGVTALLVAVTPLWVVLLRTRAGDRPARLTLVGVAIGMVGLALMLLPGGTTPVAGTETDVVIWSIALMFSCFSWAFFSWRSARYSFPSHLLVTTTYEMLVAGAFLIGVGALRGERLHLEQVHANSWWALVYLVGASIVGYTCYTWLLGHAPLSLTATYAYVNPVVAVLLGFLILGEAITSDVLVGLTVVVGGVALVVTGERRHT